MNFINTFKLEEYLGKYEFNTPYLLCCSDVESYNMHEIINMADESDLELWKNLNLGYSEVKGLPKLRQTIAKTFYNNLTEENILCFAGAEDGIYCTLSTLCENFTDKNHVIVLTPCYQSLLEIPKYKNCEVTTIALKEDNNWRINIDIIEQNIKTNTKCVIINFPHNPTGQIITQQEIKKLVELLSAHNIWLFSDEVYRLLGAESHNWSSPAVDLYSKGISLGVMSKAFGMAGLRIGWIACQNLELLNKIEQLKHYTSICNSSPAEIISLIALKNINTILTRNNNLIKSNLNLLDQFFNEYSQFSWVRPKGGCTGFVKYHSNTSVDNLCLKLIEEKGVLLLPGSVYSVSSNHFRIGYGRSNMPVALSKFQEFLLTK